MAEVTITGLPDDATVVQGFFVWSGFDSEGRKMHGGIEYPYQEEDFDNHDYDAMKSIGMLVVAKERLVGAELGKYEEEEE